MSFFDRLLIVVMVVGFFGLNAVFIYDLSKRVAHLESVTFGSSRCPK